MAETATKLPVNLAKVTGRTGALEEWNPFGGFRREIVRWFDDFDRGFLRWPLRHSVFDLAPTWPTEMTFGMVPAVDAAEKDKQYEISAELPGLDQNNIEITVSNGILTIKGEKQEDKEEKKKDYYLSERRYGVFQRSFRIPGDVDAEKIEAAFKNGILTVTLPKLAAAQREDKEKKVPLKAA
jgi:HSP20 family protein